MIIGFQLKMAHYRRLGCMCFTT